MDIKSSIKRHVTRFKTPKAYRKYGKSIQNPSGELIYQDNGGKILAVGHLDHVLWNRECIVDDDGIYECPQLDDRLGVAIILELLPLLVDEPVDILLTDCEEIGQSTAEFFERNKRYRYAVEFDRAGSDTVFYQYGDGSLEASVARCGIECGWGSFTDICSLEQLGCQAMNWGCGYHDQHTMSCYCDFAEVEMQLMKFRQWYKSFGKASYKWAKPKAKKRKRSSLFDKVRKIEREVSSGYGSRVPFTELVTCDVCGCKENDEYDIRCIECASVMRGHRNGELA